MKRIYWLFVKIVLFSLDTFTTSVDMRTGLSVAKSDRETISAARWGEGAVLVGFGLIYF